ncbi:MAG: hypothetical protein U0350_30725 [Caldilineaceae bacterium]
MATQQNGSWPIYVQDRAGHNIYLTWERWEHALGHPGMQEKLLNVLLDTLCKGGRKQDRYDPAKYKYTQAFPDLPLAYTHMEVVVKFGWHASGAANNFVLTAYLIEKW